MKLFVNAAVIATLLLGAVTATQAADAVSASQTGSWLTLAQGDTEAQAAPATKAPPLPFLSIEGPSGGAITPMAYLCNGGAVGQKCSRPSVAYTFVKMSSKYLHAVSVSQVFFNRLELSYAYNYFNVGSLKNDVKIAGLDLGRDDVNLHHFNARVNILPENSFDLPLPALTGGVHVKYNDGIKQMDKNLGGALKGLGYNDNLGVDYTLTATKMFPELAFGRPVIVTAGLRWSKAAQLGLLGFGDTCHTTFEGSVAYLPVDNICLAYEFRQKKNPYSRLQGLIDEEEEWQAISASWIVNDRLTFTGVVGIFGNIANAGGDGSLGIQVKYEF